MSRKWFLTWNAREVVDTESFELYQDHSWILGVSGKIDKAIKYYKKTLALQPDFEKENRKIKDLEKPAFRYENLN